MAAVTFAAVSACFFQTKLNVEGSEYCGGK
jgi:hypothetical protein